MPMIEEFEKNILPIQKDKKEEAEIIIQHPSPEIQERLIEDFIEHTLENN